MIVISLFLVLIVILFIVLQSLRRTFSPTGRTHAVGALFNPSVGTAFAEHAPTTSQGEVLLPYTSYKRLRWQVRGGLIFSVILLVILLIGLSTVPVFAAALTIPLLGLSFVSTVFATFSLIHLVPRGQRLQTLRTLFVADPRLIFAQYAQKSDTGEVLVGYTTYKKLTKVATVLVVVLVAAAGVGLFRQINQAQRVASENFAATAEQLKMVLSGQGTLREEFGKLVAQSLQPAPSIDEESLTQRVLSEVTKNLPEPPTQIIRETETIVTDKTTIAENESTVFRIKQGGKVVFQDENGVTFVTFNGSGQEIIENSGILNLKGAWQIDGATVDPTAEELNVVAHLGDTDEGAEGARLIGTRAANFENFSADRDDVEAVLAAIDEQLGDTGVDAGTYGSASAIPVITVDSKGKITNASTSALSVGFTAAGTSGTNQTISNGDTLTLAAGTGITTTGGSTDTITIASTLGTSIAASEVDADALDFTEFKDSLTLDTSTDIAVANSDVFSVTNSGSGISFRVNDDSGDTTPFVIDASGNVGIGTTSPAVSLEVGGTVRLPSTVLVQHGSGVRFIHNTGTENTFMGSQTGSTSVTGNRNAGFGYWVLRVISSGAQNTGVGTYTLYQNNTGSANTAVGYNNLAASANFSNNTGVGATVLPNTTGDGNTAVGSNAGNSVTTGTNNTYLGYNAGNSGTSAGLSNAGALGYNAQVTASNSLILGQISTATNIGIGTTAPDKLLEINGASGGTLRLTYNDSNGSATTYTDFSVSSGGDLTVAPTGNDVAVTGQLSGSDGLVTIVSAGACSDSTTTSDTNGTLCIDSSNGRIYYRYGGAWHYSAQTAGFQIPNYETEGLKVGDYVIGQLNETMNDGALHGLYVSFDDILAKKLKSMGYTSQEAFTAQDIKDLTVSGVLLVKGAAIFSSDLTIKGTLTVSSQQAGFAEIPKGGKEVTIKFPEKFAKKPVVTATIEGSVLAFATDEVSTEGFVIKLAKPASTPVSFAWTAFAVDKPVTVKGTVAGDSTEVEDTPSEEGTTQDNHHEEQSSPQSSEAPSPTPSPTPSVVPTVAPVVSPTPSQPAQPSPQLAPSPEATPEE